MNIATDKTLKIALMDSSPLALAGLSYFVQSLGVQQEILLQETGLRKIAEALMYQSFDVLITDLYSYSENLNECRDTILRLCRLFPDLTVIVYTSCQSGEEMRSLLCEPNVSLVARDDPLTKVADCFRQVLSGRRFLSHKICTYLAKPKSSVDSTARHLTLSENEVLKYLFNGMSLGEIAALKKLSIKTISAHKCNAMRKLEVKNDAGLFMLKNDILSVMDFAVMGRS